LPIQAAVFSKHFWKAQGTIRASVLWQVGYCRYNRKRTT